MDEHMKVEFVGVPRGLRTLVAALKAEGVRAAYEPPIEDQGVGAAVFTVVVDVTSQNAVDDLQESVRRALQRWRSQERRSSAIVL